MERLPHASWQNTPCFMLENRSSCYSFFFFLSHQTRALGEMRIPGSTGPEGIGTLAKFCEVSTALWNMKKIKDKKTQPSELNLK